MRLRDHFFKKKKANRGMGGVKKAKSQKKSQSLFKMSEAASPAAKVLGQPRGAATEAKRKLAADDDDKDDEDDEDDEDTDHASVATYDSLLESGGESDEEAVDAEVRGRARRHFIASAPTGSEADDGRRKSLADKGWCRRSVVVQAVGPSGASNLEKVPGREDYASDEAGALEWAAAALAFAWGNDGELQ